MHQVYIGLGSNLNHPVEQIKIALQSINSLNGVELIKQSSIYTSKPQGPQDQPDFANAVCKIQTVLTPQDLLSNLQQIEAQQGRVKLRHWGERLIDLDILLFDDLSVQTDNLTIPHAQMHLRDFVLVPLEEIAGNITLPGLGSLQTLLSQLEESFLIRV